MNKLKDGSGTTRRSSKNSSTPSPSHSVHAPTGALNENNLGSISEIVKPLTGHANFSENVKRCGFLSFDAISNIAIPSAKSNAVRKLSARRCSKPILIIMRSTTTSILCLNFLSKVVTSSKS